MINNASTATSYNTFNANKQTKITDKDLLLTKGALLLTAIDKAEYKYNYNYYKINTDISNVVDDYANAFNDDELAVFTSSILKNEYYYLSWRELVFNGIIYNNAIQITPQLLKNITSILNKSNVFLTVCNAYMSKSTDMKAGIALLTCQELVDLIAYAYYTNNKTAINDIMNHANDADFISFMIVWLQLHSSYELIAKLASMPTVNKDYKTNIERMLALKLDPLRMSSSSHDDADNLIKSAIRMMNIINNTENIHVDDDTANSILLNNSHVPFSYAAVSNDVIQNDSMRALLLEAYTLAVNDFRHEYNGIVNDNINYDYRLDDCFIGEISRFIMLVNDHPGLTTEFRREVIMSCLGWC